jgi:hypothetical protein
MRLKIIDELLSETERIFMAGARLAPGDIRLKKHIETLEKLGEKSPPFKKLSEKFSTLYNASEDTASQALLEAASLLQSITAVMSDSAPDKPISPHTGTMTYIQSYPLSYDILQHMLTHTDVKNRAINGSYDYFLDPRLNDYVIASLRNNAQTETIPNEAVLLTGTDIIPRLVDALNEKKRAYYMKISVLRALHILSYPVTYEMVCEIFDKGSQYILETADIIKDYPEGIEFLKKRYAEAVEFLPKKKDYLLARHDYFGIAMLLFNGLRLVEEFKFWTEKMPMAFCNAINRGYIASYPNEFFFKKITTSDGVNKDPEVMRAWEEIFKIDNSLTGFIILNYDNKIKLAEYLYSAICEGTRASFSEKRCNDSLRQLYSLFSEKEREEFIEKVKDSGYKNGMVPNCFSCVINIMKGE